MDRALLISKVKGMEDNMAPVGGDSATVLDIADFPELKGKKEGDTVSITFKVDNVKGRQVHLSPAGMDQPEDKTIPPADEEYRQPAEPPADEQSQQPISQGGM